MDMNAASKGELYRENDYLRSQIKLLEKQLVAAVRNKQWSEGERVI